MSRHDVMEELKSHGIETAPELAEAIKKEKPFDISLMAGNTTGEKKAS